MSVSSRSRIIPAILTRIQHEAEVFFFFLELILYIYLLIGMSICRYILFSQLYRTTYRTPQDPTKFWISALKNVNISVSVGSTHVFKLRKPFIAVFKILCAQDLSIYRLQIRELSWLATKTERKHSSSCSICWASSSLSFLQLGSEITRLLIVHPQQLCGDIKLCGAVDTPKGQDAV